MGSGRDQFWSIRVNLVLQYYNESTSMLKRVATVNSGFASQGFVSQGFVSQGLLIQLRSHYPAGCLRSELLQVVEGQYVVRAMVEVEGVVIATGMAAAAAIEPAEDQARARVMAVMGLTPLNLPEPKVESTAARIPDVVAALPVMAAPAIVLPEPEPEVIEPIAADDQAEDDVTQSESKSTKSKAKSTKSKATPKLDPVPPPEPLVEMTGGADEDEIEYEFTIEGDDGIDSTEAMTETTVPEPTIDLSDAIAQIGAEIERIGWTKKQGSAYLQEAYSKRTRAELTETELLSFLHYLKALPSKLQPALSDLPF
jgi:hypothetical protein